MKSTQVYLHVRNVERHAKMNVALRNMHEILIGKQKKYFLLLLRVIVNLCVSNSDVKLL